MNVKIAKSQNRKIARLNKKAFTLSEVLITLTVIGVVAALAIPALLTTTNDAENKTAWKKYFAEINNAYMNLKREQGGLEQYFGVVNSHGTLREDFINQFNIIGDLNSGLYNIPNGDIFGYVVSYKSQAGNIINYNNFAYANAKLAGGAQIYFRTYNAEEVLLWVDVNGYTKGPNTLGKDMFGTIFTKDWIKPMGAIGTGVEDTCTEVELTCPSANGFHNGNFCAGAGCSAEYLMK